MYAAAKQNRGIGISTTCTAILRSYHPTIIDNTRLPDLPNKRMKPSYLKPSYEALVTRCLLVVPSGTCYTPGIFCLQLLNHPSPGYAAQAAIWSLVDTRTRQAAAAPNVHRAEHIRHAPHTNIMRVSWAT